MRIGLLIWFVLVVASCTGDRLNQSHAPAAGSSATSTAANLPKSDDQEWRSKKPNPDQPRPLSLPDVQRFKLHNGIPVYVVENRAVPLAVTRLLVKAGTCDEPAGKAGLANFVASMITARDEVTDQFESDGGTIATGATSDSSFVSLEVLTSSWQRSIQLLAQLVQHPSFEAGSLERRRSATLADIRRLADSGSQLSAQVLQSAVYGKESSCASPLSGTKQSVAHFSRPDLVAFSRLHWYPNNTAIVVVGDLDSGHVVRVLEDTFGRWEPSKKGRKPARETHLSPASEKRVILVNRAGAAQTSFALGHPGPPIDSGDWPAVVVMSRALGGFYFSRVTRNLRIEKGIIYASNSTGLMPRRERSIVSLRNGVPTDKAGIAMREILKEIRGMIDSPPRDEELQLAKNSVADGLALRLQGNSQIAAFLDEVAVNDLPAEYLRSYYEKLRSVTTEQIADAARKFLTPDELNIVLVGPVDALKRDRELLTLGSPIQIAADEYVDRGFHPSAGQW